MANVGVSGCPELQNWIGKCSQSGFGLVMRLEPVVPDEDGLQEQCPIPLWMRKYLAAAGGVQVNWDGANQIFQTDTSAGYPCFSIFCNSTGQDPPLDTQVVIRKQPQVGDATDYPLPLPTTDADGNAEFWVRQPADSLCYTVFTFVCNSY